MSLYLKRNRGKTICFAIAITAVFFGVSFYALAQKAPSPGSANDDAARRPNEPHGLTGALSIGPIEGLTTAWHTAPAETAIPLGITLQFRQPAPPEATVVWTGAQEV